MLRNHLRKAAYVWEYFTGMLVKFCTVIVMVITMEEGLFFLILNFCFFIFFYFILFLNFTILY